MIGRDFKKPIFVIPKILTTKKNCYKKSERRKLFSQDNQSSSNLEGKIKKIIKVSKENICGQGN